MPTAARSRKRKDGDDPFDSPEFSENFYDDDENEVDDDYVDPVASMRNELYTMINEMIEGLVRVYADDHPIQNMDPDTVATNWEECVWQSSAKDDDFADYKYRIHQELKHGDDYNLDAKRRMINGVVPAQEVGTLLYKLMLEYLNTGRRKIQMRSAPRRRPAVDTSEFLPSFQPDPEGDRLRALAVMNKLKDDALNAENPTRPLSHTDRARLQCRQSFQRHIRDLVALLTADDELKNIDVVGLAAAMEDNLWENHGGSDDPDNYAKAARDWEESMQDWETYWDSDEGDVVNSTTGHESFEACVRVEFEGRHIQYGDDSGTQANSDFDNELAALGGWDSDAVAGASEDADGETDDDDFYNTGDDNDSRHPFQPAHSGPADSTSADRSSFHDIDSVLSPPLHGEGTEEHVDVRSDHHEDQKATQGSKSPSSPAEQSGEYAAPAGQANDTAGDTIPVDSSLYQPQSAPTTLHLPGILVGDGSNIHVSQPQTSSAQHEVVPPALTAADDSGMDYESTPADATVHVPRTSQAAQPVPPMQSTQTSAQPVQSMQPAVQPIQNAASEDVDMTDGSHVPQADQSMQPVQQTQSLSQSTKSVTSEDVLMGDDAPVARLEQSKATDKVHSTTAGFQPTGQQKAFDPAFNNPLFPTGYLENLQKQAAIFNQNVKLPPTQTSRFFAAALGNKPTTAPPAIDQGSMQQSQSGPLFTSNLTRPLQGSDGEKAPSSSAPPFTLDPAALSNLSNILSSIPKPPDVAMTHDAPPIPPAASIGNSSLMNQSSAVPDATTSLQIVAGMSSSGGPIAEPPAQPKIGYAPLPHFSTPGLASIPSKPMASAQSYSGLLNPEDAFKQPGFAVAANDASHPVLFSSLSGVAPVNKPTASPFEWKLPVPKESTLLEPKLTENAGNGTNPPLFRLNKEATKTPFSMFPSAPGTKTPLGLFPSAQKEIKPVAPPLFDIAGLDFGVSEGVKTAGQSKIDIKFADTGNLIKTPAVLQPSTEGLEEAPKATEFQQPQALADSAESPTTNLPDKALEVALVAPLGESVAEAEGPKISTTFNFKPVGRGAQMASTFKSAIFDASAWGAGGAQFFAAAPLEPVEAIEDGETPPLAPDSAGEESVQHHEEVLAAPSTSASNAEVEDVGARLGDGGETVAEDESANEHAEIARDDAAAEVHEPLPAVLEDAPSEPSNPPSEEVSITAASRDGRSSPKPSLSSRRSEEFKVLVSRIASLEVIADGLDEDVKVLGAKATALRVEAGEIKVCLANFAPSETTSAVQVAAQTSRIATEHEEKEATVMTEAVDVEAIRQQPQEPTSVEDHAPSTALAKQNVKDALVSGVDIANNKILPQGIKAPGVDPSVVSSLGPASDKPSSGVDVSNNTILPQGIKAPGVDPSVVSAPGPSSDIINKILPQGNKAPGANPSVESEREAQNGSASATPQDKPVNTARTIVGPTGGVFKCGRKRPFKSVFQFDDSPPEVQAPIYLLSLEDRPHVLLKNLLEGMNTQEAKLLELQLSGSLGEGMRILASDRINDKLKVAELAEMRLYSEGAGNFKSRLVRIRLASEVTYSKMVMWERMIKDTLPGSFLETGEGLNIECRTLLRFNRPATLRTLKDSAKKWAALTNLAVMYKRLVKVNAEVNDILPRWRWPTSSAEKDRLGDILKEKLAFALDAYHKFFVSARKLEQHAPGLFAFTTLLGADICKTLVDNRLEFTKWHSELNINMPELSIDVSTTLSLGTLGASS